MLGASSASASPRILLTTDAVGGVWRYTMELAAGLRALGAEIRVVSLGPAPSPAQRAEAGECLHITDLALDWLADSPAALARSALGLSAIARGWAAEIIHLHVPALIPLADWTAPVAGVAHSCVGTWWRDVRGTAPLPPDLAWRAGLTREGLEAADLAIAPSRSFAARLTEHYRLKRSVRAVLNGRAPLPCPSMPRSDVLTVGRLWDEAKNIAVVDQAAFLAGERIRAAGPASGPNGALVSPRHLQLLGALDERELARAYARAQVFVSAARYEPFGLSVLEAAQAGCALVLSDIPSFRELWEGAALFVDANDPAEVAAGIKDARAQAAELSEAARSRARLYTRERMARATFDAYRLREAA